MRATALLCCAACVLFAIPTTGSIRAIATPVSADDAALMQAEAMQDRWQGRHSYLYDDNYQPGTETTGERPADAQACVDEPVRLRRSDGSTVVRRFRRCE